MMVCTIQSGQKDMSIHGSSICRSMSNSLAAKRWYCVPRAAQCRDSSAKSDLQSICPVVALRVDRRCCRWGPCLT